MLIFPAAFSLALATTPDSPTSFINPEDRPFAVRLHGEVGFLAPFAHRIQFGKDGTLFDYVDDGGQDLLFPVLRFSADADLGRSSFVFLYQPLQLNSEIVLQQAIRQDAVDFPANTPLSLQYGFSFWRGSYLYDLDKRNGTEIAIGLGLQLRDANIVFSSADGELRTTNRDVGPVPLLKFRARAPLGNHLWIGTEIDGVYAPVKYLNGANTDVVGALLDGSVRGGIALNHGTDVFLNLRYIGGGAEGTDKNPDGLGDGFVKNWLHFGTVSIGATVR